MTVVVDIEVDLVKPAEAALSGGWLSEVLSGDPQVVLESVYEVPSAIGGPGVDCSG